MRTLVRDQEQYIRMTQTPIPQLITKLAVPTVISMLVTAVYNTADTFFVAMLDDTAATGAVGVVFSLMSLIHATSFMVGVGCGSWISRL
ncbi:MAG: MATE family efflux transporter, partial [Oscillospiraceae bacterium]|nr:MATE family efflux transporter [Oscillospiraceae bacterium]